MKVFQRLNEFLKKPFPGQDSLWKEIRGMIIASVIVFAFLYLFKPFGMNAYSGSILLLCAMFGLVSFLASVTYLCFTKYVLKIHKDVETWTMERWILDILFMVLVIALSNYLFVIIHYNLSFSLMGLGNMLLCTTLVAIFPIVFFGYRKQMELEKLNSKSAQSFTEAIQAHTTDQTAVLPIQILAIESMQNYVHVYKMHNGLLEKETIRMTLASALLEFDKHGLLKCHRSFLVNPSLIQKIEGNAQGLKLTLSHADCPIIPVSRTYISTIKSAL